METQISLYKQAIEAYYEGNPIISDEAFDALESQLLQAGQLSKKLRFEKSNTIEAQHLIDGIIASLPSLPAIHTKSIFDEALYNHIAQNITQTQNLLIMLKYDGMSCEATYDSQGWLKQVVTKGDGITGYDCTEKWLKSGKIPAHINNILNRTVQIRFEAVVKKSEFYKLSELGYKNERNAASGIVKRQDSQFIELVDPIAYIVTVKHGDMHGHDTCYMTGNTAKLLSQFGWDADYIAGQWSVSTFEQWEHICVTMTNDRDALPYRIDGLVMYPDKMHDNLERQFFEVQTNGAEYTNMVALKLDALSAVTKVTRIDWRQRIDGELFPRVELEPVELDGTTVKAASGFNYGFLNDNDIWPGALVRIEKGGDIIPDIQECIQPGDKSKAGIPEHAYIDGIHLMLPPEFALEKRFINGVLTLGVDGMGWNFAKRIYESMYQLQDNHEPVFQDLYMLVVNSNRQQLADALSFDLNKKSDAKVIDGCIDRCKNIWADHYFKCLQIPGLGAKACWNLAMYLDKCEYSFDGLERAPIDEALTNYIKQYQTYVGHTIKSGKVMLQEIADEAAQRLQNAGQTTNTSKLKVVMTGSPKSAGFKTKSELLQKFAQLEDVGDNVDICDLVLTNDLSKSSSKMKKAEAKGANIMTYENFVKQNS